MQEEVNFIIVNDTRRPRTGGDYVYSVMKDELIKQGYRVNEWSIPILVNAIRRSSASSWIGQTYLSPHELLAYARCYLTSLKKYRKCASLVITSSCPTFPVLGHMTYHQPKAGIFARSIKESGSIRRMIGYKIEENEKFSPLWFSAKRLIRLHLSNSKFTKELVRKMYGVNSSVLYPPIPTSKYYHLDRKGSRKSSILITRPEATTGVSFLSEVASLLPKDVTFVIIGNIDKAGREALRYIKNVGIGYEYLGFVNEEAKIEAFRNCSVYINLARNETFGMSVVEAMASGCIPIAHESGAIPEYLPEKFCYSELQEIPEKVAAFINAKSDVRDELRHISSRFDEGVFRKRFMFFFRSLENCRDSLKCSHEKR
jgi:glycosyltransferase involved in cell wall biosynthesis